MSTDIEQLRRFARLSDKLGLIDLSAHWLAIIALWMTAHHFASFPVYFICAIFIAGLQHGLLNLQHDAWHILCLKRKSLNDFIGAWFYAYPAGMPYFHERHRHLEHHKYFGGENDPEKAIWGNSRLGTPIAIVQFLAGRLAGSMFFELLYSLIVKRRARVSASGKGPNSGPSLFVEFVRIAICQLIILSGFAVSGRFWEYFVLWFIPLVTFAAFFVSIRSFVEHSNPAKGVSPEQRLFDFAPNFAERFFISPCDFNFHAVHHAYPAVPHFRLRNLQQYLKQENCHYPGCQTNGYFGKLMSHGLALNQMKAHQVSSKPNVWGKS